MNEYPEELELTGIYIRIERNGKWQSIDITDTSREERDHYFCAIRPGHERKMLDAVIHQIRVNIACENCGAPTLGDVPMLLCTNCIAVQWKVGT